MAVQDALARVAGTETNVTGVGTAYSLTNSLAAVTFGTTSPVLSTLPTGTYLVIAQIGATGCTANDVVQAELYNTTGSAAFGLAQQVQSASTGAVTMTIIGTISFSVPSTLTIWAQNMTGARGTVVSTLTRLDAFKIA